MKSTLLLFSTLASSFFASAQLVPCRPKICMIDYNLHNDAAPNADMSTIQGVKPDFLVDNTPGGYWGQLNGGIGCLPAQYPSVKVFSYITSGYEGTEYGTSEDALASNLSRIDLIANDGAAGVFLDEVDHHPNAAGMSYITSIYNECKAKNLLLILNPGVTSFDTALMSRCDYILTDENYSGTRQPINQEIPYHDRVIVVAQNITSAVDAANITLGARNNGFGFSYACEAYVSLPSYLSSYMSLATVHPTTPVITQVGNNFHSTAPYGNQWYGPQGIIPADTEQDIIPQDPGDYYAIVTLQGCSSDTSNKLHQSSPTAVSGVAGTASFRIFPNPAMDFVNIDIDNADLKEATLTVYDMLGREMKTGNLKKLRNQFYIGNLSNGIYSVVLKCTGRMERLQLAIQR